MIKSSSLGSPEVSRYWLLVQHWFSARSRRERLLIAVSAIAVVYVIGHYFWLQPAREQLQVSTVQVQQHASEAANLRDEIARLETELQRDPNAHLRQQLTQLQTRQVRLTARLNERAQLMPINASVSWIDALLDIPMGLHLVSFDTYPAEPIVAPSDDIQGANVWRHAVQVVVRGRYHDIRDYVEALERLNQPFYWHGLRYEVIEHPQAQLSIRVYALNTAQELLGG